MAVAHKGSIAISMLLIPSGLYKTTVNNRYKTKNRQVSNLLKVAILKLWSFLTAPLILRLL